MNSLSKLVKKIPISVELLFVTALCFGLPVFGSIAKFATGEAFKKTEIDASRGVAILIFEIPLIIVVTAFLYLRGFNLWTQIPWRPTLKATILSIALFFVTNLAFYILFIGVALTAGYENIGVSGLKVAMPMWLIVAVAFVNPIFEETFIVGYLFERGKNFGFWAIFTISCLIRVSYHLYQGWLGIISILPYGIIFALAYARTRNLWPLVLAHAMQDFVAFSFSPR